MLKAISNTSPLLYLYKADLIQLLPNLFDHIQVTSAVRDEFTDGINSGYDVPLLKNYSWIEVVEALPSPAEWLSADLGKGELTTIFLALANPGNIVILDDLLARKRAQAAGLNVWGTLKVILEFKNKGVVDLVKPIIERLKGSGMYISDQVKARILAVAREV